MNWSPVLGPAAPELGWIPAPRYLLRRDRIRRIVNTIPVTRLLEVGPGAGALLVEFAQAGIHCEALEQSEQARQLASQFLARFAVEVPLHAEPGSEWHEQFDLVCAFDVLEHIEDDATALEQWGSWIRPGGGLLLSVPAHMRNWNARDVWAGHYRRYEWTQLVHLFEQSGFTVSTFECYGFPLANLTEKAGDMVYEKKLKQRHQQGVSGKQHGTDVSGIDRSTDLTLYPLLHSVAGRQAIRFFLWLQQLFIQRDWGNGYLVLATKR